MEIPEPPVVAEEDIFERKADERVENIALLQESIRSLKEQNIALHKEIIRLRESHGYRDFSRDYEIKKLRQEKKKVLLELDEYKDNYRALSRELNTIYKEYDTFQKILKKIAPGMVEKVRDEIRRREFREKFGYAPVYNR